VFAGIAERQRADLEAVVVAAPTLRLHGFVRSSAGVALEGAELTVEAPWIGVVGFPRSLEHSSRISARWKTGAAGRFELDDVPRIPGVPLRVEAEGYAAHELTLPEVDTFDIVIELAPRGPNRDGELAPRGPNPDGTPPSGTLLFGTVETASGAFVAGADVYLGGRRTRTNDAGRWELARSNWAPDGDVLAALHPELGVGTFPEPAAWQGESDRIGPLRIEIAPNESVIRGRVIDAAGAPLQGWVVQVLDPTSIDTQAVPSATLEAGGKAKGSRARTTQDGSFAIERLLDRPYDLRAYDPVRFLSILAQKVPAGAEGLELRLAEDAQVDVLRATVRTPDGAPVVRAEVNVQFILERSATGFTWDSGKSAFTDGEGNVELRHVPRRGVNIIVSGAGIVTEALEPGDGGFTGEPLAIEVQRRVDVLVDCSGATPVLDSVQLFDRDGTALQIESRTAHGSTSLTSLQLVGGRSPVVSVSEAARTAVQLRNWNEYRRFSIELVPGQVNQLAPPD